jgi:N-acyl-D-amino-acid deacylase
LIEAIDELIQIAQAAQVSAEIYHLKEAGRDNWGKLDEVIRHVQAAQGQGLHITADMYTYTPAQPASMPPCRRGCRRAAMMNGLSA